MRKYMFRAGDIVKERTAERRPIIGRVLSFGSSTGHDYYKILSRGEVYSARDDELSLVRRAPNKFEKMGLVDQFLLNWYGADKHPAKGEECLVIWRDCDGERRIDVCEWNGMGWEMEIEPGMKATIGAEMFDAWAPWDWPDTDRKEAGEEGVDHDESADPDD